MALEVKLQVFEGPLDLLLHLIEKNKVDIYDIPIVEITDQYLETIRQMEKADMNVMSEFLVMAATLLDIKCRMLLPREKDEEGQEEDPRSELVEKLLEYKAYKYMALELKDMEVDAQKAFYREPSLPPEVRDYRQPVDYEELLRGVTLTRLNEVFQACLKRQEDKMDPVRSHFGRIEKDEVNIEHKAGYVAAYIRSHRKLNFRELLENRKSRMDVIVTFLVVLELMKTGAVNVSQEGIEEESARKRSVQLPGVPDGGHARPVRLGGHARLIGGIPRAACRAVGLFRRNGGVLRPLFRVPLRVLSLFLRLLSLDR